MLAQSVSQRGSAPDEHAAVPEIISGSQKLLRARAVRLFSKPTHAKVVAFFLRQFDVAVAGLSTPGCDTHHDDVFAISRNPRRLLKRIPKALLIADDVVGRKHSD